jgi:multidrug efflux pump subunit AcrA (membrane-fusion protein)
MVAALRSLLGLAVAAALAGCAAQSAPGSDPGARPLPPGQTCQSLRGELNKLDSRGVPAKIEAVSAGRKVSPQDKADVDRYNQLLNGYLGARCHV